MLTARAPAPPLSSFVAVLWYAEGWKPPHPRERHMPDGSVNLIVSLAEDACGPSGPPAVVSGPRSESFVLETGQMPETIIGAQFTHGGAAAVLDVPVSDLRNTHAPLAEVVGRSGALLWGRLMDASTPDGRLDLLEAWLRERMLRRPGPDGAIVWAARQLCLPRTRVGDVTTQIGRSARWIIGRFASDVGLTPKVFSRVQRFQAALRQAHQRPAVDLADLAAGAGYFDQAHLTHEFRRIAGMSPSALLAGRTEFLNHVADAEPSARRSS
jgi:AraC-like DNA-binding protein